MFLKIFTWFWLTVIMAAVGMEGAGTYARRWSSAHNSGLERLLPQAAREAAESLETGGAAGLAGYISEIQRTQSVMAYFFDGKGEEVTRRWAPAAVRSQARVALREPGFHRFGNGGEVTAEQVWSMHGLPYAMVLVTQNSSITWYWTVFPYVRLATIVCVTGIFCFLIARHVTRPVLRLQTAAAGIAEGRLETRVGADLQRRGDEIAGLARDFNRMAARIEALVHGQQELLANVSHELRSPLSRLLVALSLVRKGPAAEMPEHLERIGTEARLLDKMIGQLLTLSRIDSAAEHGERTSIDLAALLHEVADDADFEGSTSGRRVVVTGAAACQMRGDEDALRSALENVVRNAVRYTAEGTQVDVWLRCEAARSVIGVRDHGPGVPEKMLRTIFEPFQRAENGAGGCGLGLAIAQRAVAAHGGTIRADRAEGGGLVVEMELPLS